jgi:hypothetical protein
MKTSNYIFSAFLIFLFGGILLLFIGAKFYKGADNEDNFLTQEKPLNTFSVVVAEPGSNFNLKSGTKNKIIQNYLKGAVPNFAPYVVRNDTLFVSSVKKTHSKEPYFIIVPEVFCVNVKSIVAKKSATVRLEKFQADTLRVDLNGAQLNCNFTKIASISMQAKDSDIYLEGESLENLSVKLDKTKLNSPIKKGILSLSGSLKNGSECSFSRGNSVRLDADKTSRYSFYYFD